MSGQENLLVCHSYSAHVLLLHMQEIMNARETGHSPAAKASLFDATLLAENKASTSPDAHPPCKQLAEEAGSQAKPLAAPPITAAGKALCTSLHDYHSQCECCSITEASKLLPQE